MAIVASYDWESDTFTHHTGDNPARAAWREAVVTIAERAKQTLPACAGRVDRAVQLVLNHDVDLLADGTARVTSQCKGMATYVVCNGTCDCMDFPKAPSGWCKHVRFVHPKLAN